MKKCLFVLIVLMSIIACLPAHSADLTDPQLAAIEAEIADHDAKAQLSYKHKNARLEIAKSFQGIRTVILTNGSEIQKNITLLDDGSYETPESIIALAQDALTQLNTLLTAFDSDQANQLIVYGKRKISIE